MNTDIKYAATKTEILFSKIHTLSDKAARIRAKASDPVRSATWETPGSAAPDHRRREKMLTTYADHLKGIEAQILRYQGELDEFRPVIKAYLESCELKDSMKMIIRLRLLCGFSWEEIKRFPYLHDTRIKQRYEEWYQSL